MALFLTLMGTGMMVGMGAGMFVNAGLSVGEKTEQCKQINNLKQSIHNMKIEYNILRTKLLNEQTQLEEIFNSSKEKTEEMKLMVENLKKQIKISLDKEEYIYFSVVVTIIIIVFVKASIVIIYR